MTLHLVHLKNISIFEQLKIEEALLRNDRRNFCLLNEGSAPAIVMGISGKVHELVDVEKAKVESLPVIRRFSGGGTVVVDENTLFVTFIFEKNLHDFPCYPEPIMRWSDGIYRSLFSNSLLQLKENDYVIGEKKCGGNAQYIKKDRWLHHTSFLWDYQDERMNCLLHPKKTPSYREGRSHGDFVCKLNQHLSHKEELFNALKEELAKRYPLKEISFEELQSSLSQEHREATELVTF